MNQSEFDLAFAAILFVVEFWLRFGIMAGLAFFGFRVVAHCFHCLGYGLGTSGAAGLDFEQPESLDEVKVVNDGYDYSKYVALGSGELSAEELAATRAVVGDWEYQPYNADEEGEDETVV